MLCLKLFDLFERLQVRGQAVPKALVLGTIALFGLSYFYDGESIACFSTLPLVKWMKKFRYVS